MEVIFWTLFIWLNWLWQRFSFSLATEAEISSSPSVANRPSVMFIYMKQKIQWRMFAKTRNLIDRLELKSRLWLDNVEAQNRPPETHPRWTHSEVQPRTYCLGQSAKSKIPYHLIKFVIGKQVGGFLRILRFPPPI